MTSCTVEAIVALLGSMPAPGTVVDVPASYVERLSYADRSHIKSCARRHKIRWRIVEGR
jgi:hypothetical protein